MLLASGSQPWLCICLKEKLIEVALRKGKKIVGEKVEPLAPASYRTFR